MGHLEAYDEAGIEKKAWLATRTDNRTRPDHVAADGQIRQLREPFLVGGELLAAPGLGQNVSPSNVINCRCTTIPVFD